MVKIDDGHAFFNVQFARIALGVDAMEVVEAIGEVAILLHFTEDHSGANGMRRPGGNVKGVARRDRQAFKKSFEAAGFYSRLKLFSIYFGDQTKQESGARIGGDSVPHFRFARRKRHWDAPGWKADRRGKEISPRAEIGAMQVEMRSRCRAILATFSATPG